jgi:hypothetical protein
MNKVINIFSLVLLFLFSFLAIGNYEDIGISVYEINDIKYLKEICFGLIIVIGLFGLLRIQRRWTGIKDIKSFKKFAYKTPLSKKAKALVVMFSVMEIIFLSFFIGLFIKELHLDVYNYLTPMIIVLLIIIIEIIFFTIYVFNAKDVLIMGVNKNLIAFFDREIHIVYFDGLQRISIYQNRLHFKYKLDLNVFVEIDYIPQENLLDFKQALENVLAKKKIFIDNSFQELEL